MKRKIRTLLASQTGVGLVEILVAVAILGVIGVGFLLALTNTVDGTEFHEVKVTASSLAQSQVEYIKSQAYAADDPVSYVEISPLPPGYEIDVDVVEEGVGKQEVTVTVYHQGDFALSMTTLKVDW
ncbi:MAG: hypothetical protein HQ578_08710 [Chloroflexi bacterium]|nr:hypothetical protein [Chloroflexota bacterium]